MGYAKRNKRYAQESMIKKREKNKEDSLCLKKKKRGEMAHRKEFILHPPKIPTQMHILIKVYDLLLLGIQSLT
jgi:hypothetical protein